MTFDRSTRLCSRSPTMATLRPARRPLCARIVNASSSAWVGCSCIPSPALMIAERQMRASSSGAPDEAWRMTIMSGDIASRLRTVSTSVSPLRHARGGRRDAERVGAQALLGDLERGAGARARLEEQVHDRPAAEGRHLLDGPSANLLHGLGRIEDERDLVGVEAGDPEQVTRFQSRRGGLWRHGAPGWRSALSGRSAALVVMAPPR